nr:hypothetical protein [Sinorhizobium meliloti]
MAGWDDTSEEIARIRRRLAELDAERAALERALEALEQKMASDSRASEESAPADAPVTNSSPSIEKIELFRRLFAGRPDVFPVRWENRKAGRSGYSPACSNEWAKGLCGKPKVKCGECPHQAFIAPNDDIIEKHLRGGDGPLRRLRRRRVSFAPGRNVLVSRRGLRQGKLGRRCQGVAGHLPCKGSCRRPGTVAIGEWRPRLDILR